MDYANPYIRIQAYYTWFSNDKEITVLDESFDIGVSMRRLQELLNIPIEVIRNDIKTMFEWQCSLAQTLDDNDCSREYILSFDEDSPKYKDADEAYSLYFLFHDKLMEGNYPEKFTKLIQSGKLDEVPICREVAAVEPEYTLTLSQEEAAAYQSLQYETTLNRADYQLNKDLQASFLVKESYLYHHNCIDLYSKLDKVHQAIQSKSRIRITYRTPKNGIQHFHMIPVKVIYDASENLYYILASFQKKLMTYRLDRVTEITSSKEQCELPTKDQLSIIPYVWGNSFDQSPYQVKVRFKNFGNLWTKVKKDLAFHTNGRLYMDETGEFFYYEDTVYGIEKFRSWLRGFGYDAIVLEPRELREKIIESLEKQLINHQPDK